VGTLYLIIRRFFNYFKSIYFETSGLSFLVQIIQTLAAFFIFLAIGGSGSEFEYLFIFLISSIVAMLPITIGGVGSREITFLYGSMLLGLDKNLSIAMSLMFYLITAFVSSWGIYYSIKSNWEGK